MESKSSEESILKQRGYKLLESIGKGSYSKVYNAEYDLSGETVKGLACKIIDVKIVPKKYVSKFLPRELELLRKVKHPYIIQIHSIYQWRNKYYCFMRHAEKGNLLDYIIEHGIIPELQARLWHRQIVLAVQYLHELGYAHRDIKCENILLTKNLNAKLGDFGFVRKVYDTEGRQELSDTFCGSISYAAPEILRGKKYTPLTVDIWSLGVVLYVMLNRRLPFTSKNYRELHRDQWRRKWKFREKVVNVLSKEVKEVIKRLLEPDYKRRWTLERMLNSEWYKLEPAFDTVANSENASLNIARSYMELSSAKTEKDNISESSLANTSESVNILKNPTKYFPYLPSRRHQVHSLRNDETEKVDEDSMFDIEDI